MGRRTSWNKVGELRCRKDGKQKGDGAVYGAMEGAGRIGFGGGWCRTWVAFAFVHLSKKCG
jgi:hypothetical protein